MGNDNSFDVAVIGAGAAGLAAAGACAVLGAATCLIERDRPGGGTVREGCVPSKAFVRAAGAVQAAQSLSSFGAHFSGNAFLDTSGVLGRVRTVGRDICARESPEDLARRGITYVSGAARFIDWNSMEIDGRMVTARRYIVATGSRPLVPSIPGLKETGYLTPGSFFALDRLPESLIILGGEANGAELAGAAARLKSRVTLIEAADRILSKEDAEAVSLVERKLKESGVEVLAGHRAVRFARSGKEKTVVVQNREGRTREIAAAAVLVTAGRRPNVEGLNLEAAGVDVTPDGIAVNRYLQTGNGRIFACGDVAGPHRFVNVAAYQGRLCARNALLRKIAWKKADYGAVAWTTFTDPEIARLGLTEEEARARHGEVKVYTLPYGECDRAAADRLAEGFVKVITDRSHHILGAHIAGASASELIHLFMMARQFDIALPRMGRMMFVYPTLSELAQKIAILPQQERYRNSLMSETLEALKLK